MSSSNSSNDAILVNQGNTAMISHEDDVSGGLEIHVHSPSTTGESGEMEDQMLQYNRPKTFRKLSNSSSIISEIFRHPNTCEDRLRVKIKRANDRDNSKELIEFLRTTSPPSQNRMPPLENHADLSRKQARLPFWAICKRLKARKARKKAKIQPAPPPPPLLRLPDSAVVGRTVGGHRHIAISIPIEHAHLGDEPGSSVPARTLTSPLIGMDRVPARVSSARSNAIVSNPGKETGARSEGSLQTPGTVVYHWNKTTANGLETPSPELENMRPQTAEPLGVQRSLPGVSGTPRDDLAVGMYQPVHRHSFGYSAIGIHESPDGVSVRRHHHWSWPADSKLGRKQSSTSESTVMNRTEAELANAMAMRGYSPRLSLTGADHYRSLSELRSEQSIMTFPDMGMALTSDLRSQKSMAQMSYHELINHGPDSSGSENEDVTRAQTLRSLTVDLPSYYPFPLCPGEPRVKQVEELLHLTPVMTVVDVEPALSMESLRSSQVSTPQPPRVSAVPDSSSPVSSLEDGEITPRATAKQPIHHPSIEQFLFTRNPHLVDIVSPSSNIRNSNPHLVDINSSSSNIRSSNPPLPYTHSPIRDYKQSQGERKVPRSDSHQALAKRYQELRETRDEEMDILLDRLERLENKNDWWLNSVVPMVENMTRRLTRVYDDDALPRLSHERAQTRRQNRSSSFPDLRDITTTPRRTASSSTAIHTPLNNPHSNYLPSESYSSSLSFLPSHEQSAPFCHNQTRSLEPESRFESFDSFLDHHHPITTSDTPPAREPSPYPYPYIYPGESHDDDDDEIYIQGEEDYYQAAARHFSLGSGHSNDNNTASLPHHHETEIPSSWDSRHGGREESQWYGDDMGLAVDRLPSRHGERRLLNTLVATPPATDNHLNTTSVSRSAQTPHSNPQSRSIFIPQGNNEYRHGHQPTRQPRRQDVHWATSIPASSKGSTNASRSRPISWPSRREFSLSSSSSRRRNCEAEEDVSMRSSYDDERSSSSEVVDYENENEQVRRRRQTEWDTLEPLMRGLMETTRLDLELGRNLDLGLSGG